MVFRQHKTPDWLISLFLETDKRILLNERTNEREKEQITERENEEREQTNKHFFSVGIC